MSCDILFTCFISYWTLSYPSHFFSLENFTTCHIRTRELFRCSKHLSLIPFSARSHCGNSVRSLFKSLLFPAGVGRQTVRPLTAAWRCSCTSSLGSGRNTVPAVAAARGLVNPAARKEAGPLLVAAPVGPIWGSCSRCFPPFFVFFLFFFFWKCQLCDSSRRGSATPTVRGATMQQCAVNAAQGRSCADGRKHVYWLQPAEAAGRLMSVRIREQVFAEC